MAVVTAIAPAVVAGRPNALTSGRPVRIAAPDLGGPDLPAILGIELLGARAELVGRLADADAVHRAFAGNRIDAVLLRGHRVPDQVKAIAAVGAQPLFALGFPGDSGGSWRTPELSNVAVAG